MKLLLTLALCLLSTVIKASESHEAESSAFPGMQLTRNIDEDSQLLDRLSISIDDIDAAAIKELVVAINHNITGAIR